MSRPIGRKKSLRTRRLLNELRYHPAKRTVTDVMDELEMLLGVEFRLDEQGTAEEVKPPIKRDNIQARWGAHFPEV